VEHPEPPQSVQVEVVTEKVEEVAKKDPCIHCRSPVLELNRLDFRQCRDSALENCQVIALGIDLEQGDLLNAFPFANLIDGYGFDGSLLASPSWRRANSEDISESSAAWRTTVPGSLETATL
jgi:hypothetical protein